MRSIACNSGCACRVYDPGLDPRRAILATTLRHHEGCGAAAPTGAVGAVAVSGHTGCVLMLSEISSTADMGQFSLVNVSQKHCMHSREGGSPVSMV